MVLVKNAKQANSTFFEKHAFFFSRKKYRDKCCESARVNDVALSPIRELINAESEHFFLGFKTCPLHWTVLAKYLSAVRMLPEAEKGIAFTSNWTNFEVSLV